MLLTKADRAKLPQLYQQDECPDPMAWIKYFCPWNQWVWLATEGSGVAYTQRERDGKITDATDAEVESLCRLWQDRGQPSFPFLIGDHALGGIPSVLQALEDFRFFGYVHGHCDELGYFSLKELKSVHGPGIWQALGIERDLYFTPKPLSQVLADYTKSHGWTPTWTPREETAAETYERHIAEAKAAETSDE